MENSIEPEESFATVSIYEIAALALNALLSRIWMFILAGLVGVPLAWFIAKQLPKTFVAEAIILTQPANQRVAGTVTDIERHNSVEQLRVLEAWIKSEHVFSSLLPELLDEKIPKSPEERAIAMEKLRSSLEFELIGRSVIRARFSGKKAEGLGRKLEVVLTKLVSGLIEPDSGILTATQLIATHQKETLSSASDRLLLLIQEAGLTDNPDLRRELANYAAVARQYDRLLNEHSRNSLNDTSSDTANSRSTSEALAEAKRLFDLIRSKFQLDPDTLLRLSKASERYEQAKSLVEQLNNDGTSERNYIGIFASPERLTIVGRPKDPVLSKSSRLKIAIAVVFLAMLLPLALVLLLELRDNRLKWRRQFETIGGLQVISRVPRAS